MRTKVVLACALALSGCAMATPVQAEHVLTGAPREAYTGVVKVVMEGAEVGAPYEEIAIVSATGSGDRATLSEVLGALQREAASVGADAVIRVRYDRGATSATATGVAVRLAAAQGR
jgi:uncharacterized protein YbjQ (UPF0145 family)